MDNEKQYLKCLDCGEVFDDLTAAKEHETDCLPIGIEHPEYTIVPESKAF